MSEIRHIIDAVENRLHQIGHKVNAIVNYDRFSITAELVDDYIHLVKDIMERHYHSVTRYTSSPFVRMKLGEALTRCQVPPQLYACANEAAASLQKT